MLDTPKWRQRSSPRQLLIPINNAGFDSMEKFVKSLLGPAYNTSSQTKLCIVCNRNRLLKLRVSTNLQDRTEDFLVTIIRAVVNTD